MTLCRLALILMLSSLLLVRASLAADTCSRVAIINYQEVLVDTSSTQKGEGLRFHLEKDELAKQFLNEYQKGTEMRWQNALLGTLGTGLIITGLFTNSSSNNRKAFFISGGAFIAINFFVARTLEAANEKNLVRAIEEYNKRNLPRIYFSPDQDGEVFIEKSWSF